MFIADHARKDCPLGSISWTFIEKSLESGKLEEIEKHRAGPTTNIIREVGSARPARSGRTAFTAQDDRDLIIWVTKAERSGISTKGNETYKQLETIVRFAVSVCRATADGRSRTLGIHFSHGAIAGSNISLAGLALP